jgi:hypothetical protein
VIEKECFAIFYCVLKLTYYLTGKSFRILTDHNNLLWMQSSLIPKIVRMRIYLQQFSFTVSHIKGKENGFADWLSRDFVEPQLVFLSMLSEEQPVSSGSDSAGVEETGDEVSRAIRKVHNARMGHYGVRRTWNALNKHLPGHAIPIKAVRDFVEGCVWCQKLRKDMVDSLPAPVRALDQSFPRNYCGYDTLYVSPADEDGFQYIHVFKLLPSRIVGLFPSRDLSADSLAAAMFQFFVTYGVTEVIVTDPGANITSEVVGKLLAWFGVRLQLSLVGRHQSNYVERTNREVLRFLSALVHSERLIKVWSKPHVISCVQFLLNEAVNGETGVSPFEHMFGSLDASYFTLPTKELVGASGSFIRALNENLKAVREEASRIVLGEQVKRLKDGAGRNSYQIGDLVFRRTQKMVDRKDKLSPVYLGPYEVVQVHKADVQCRHLVTRAISTFHMDVLKPCFSSQEEAYKAAMVDYDQFVVDRILSYRGDPDSRSGMEFEVRFMDGSVVWLPSSKDLSDPVQLEDFVRANRPLQPFL